MYPLFIFTCDTLDNNPVVLMIKPDSILIQEIKVQPAKAKIMDMVVIRHQTTYTDSRTTLILLCEDGSLRMYMASAEHTGEFKTLEAKEKVNSYALLNEK